jgi:hypothetical protein
MARIVTVHGIGKQVEGEFTLGWSDALRSGVVLAGGPALYADDIKPAFYGSLFRKRFAKGFGDPVPLEYSIGCVICTVASMMDAVMVGLPGAAQDRLPADVPDTRPGRPGVPRRPGE